MEQTYSFGYWLRRWRKALDLTQEQLAGRAGCVVTTIKKIEADARRPSKQLAEILADVLNIPTEERAAFLKTARGDLIADGLAVAAQPIASSATLGDTLSLPSGTVTFLFTDIEGSTQLWERHSEAMGAALARHDIILRQAIEAHAGVVVKTVGDGFHAAFATAVDALTAALDAQRALVAEMRGETGPLRVRMALHTGTAEVRDGDYFGTTLNRTARLLAAGHGGQVLLSLAAAELVREQLPAETELRDLGLHRLKDLSLPEQIFQLLAGGLPTEFPPLNTLNPRRTNLPVPLTALIGREHEVAGVSALLRQAKVRLVTLTGPGGIGKTRLSLQIAAELSAEFADGVYFVDLGPIRDASLVAATIAHTLGVRENGAQPLFERLKEYLREKHMLLLVDNFEQVLQAGTVMAELLAAAVQLKLLVTSRERLHLRGEKEIAVQPLAMPDPADLPALEQLSQYTAVELFVERALDVQADFELTTVNAPAIAEICARLDGLPLAIELAAARLKLFSPRALLARLTSRLVLLSGGARDLPKRQQTIRSTIAWSYDLLNQAEQSLFRRLGVFVGGCTLEALEAVCNADNDLPIDVVDGVTALVDKSLLRQENEVEGEPRFSMLEIIREYALEQLVTSGEDPSIQRQLAGYFVTLAEEAEQGLRGPEQLEWLQLLEREHDNVRAVLAWSQTTPDGTSIELRLTGALWWLWYFRGHFQEGSRWAREVLALPEAQAPTPARAKALASAGILAWAQGDFVTARGWLEESAAIGRSDHSQPILAFALMGLAWASSFQGDYVVAASVAEESLNLYRALGAPWDQAHVLLCLTNMKVARGDHVAARRLGEESLALFRATGDTWGRAWVLVNLGFASQAAGDYVQAAELFEEGLVYSSKVGDRWAISTVLANLGHLARAQGDDIQAAARYTESLELFQELGDKAGIASVRHNQAYLALHQNDPVHAEALLRESIALSGDGKSDWQIAYDLAGLGGVAVARGQSKRAARLLGAADAWFTQSGDMPAPSERAEHDSYVAAARAQLDEALFAAAWAEGQAMSLEQAIAEVLHTKV